MKKWQDKTRKEKGLPGNQVCDLEFTKEENKELATLMVKLENGAFSGYKPELRIKLGDEYKIGDKVKVVIKK